MSMHIDAKKGEIAKTVVVGGDPARIKHIAETYLESPRLVNEKRAALCYTGKYKGKEISVMAVGMGIPSMMIYATELFGEYDCDAIIRIGTSGSYLPDMRLYDVVLSQAACHTSGLNEGIFGGTFCPIADFGLLSIADRLAKERGMRSYVGNTVCNDRIYRGPETGYKSAMWKKYGILCSEMEGAGLYTVAAEYGKKALMIVSISTKIILDEDGTEHFVDLPEEPGRSIDDGIVLTLDTACEFEASR